MPFFIIRYYLMKRIFISILLLITTTTVIAESTCNEFGTFAALITLGRNNGLSIKEITKIAINDLSPYDAAIAKGIILAIYLDKWDDPTVARQAIVNLCNKGWKR